MQYINSQAENRPLNGSNISNGFATMYMLPRSVNVADFKAGKDRAVGFLVGQAMKETKGKANPQMLNKMFAEELKK